MPSFSSLQEIQQLIQEKEVSCMEVVQYYLQNIQQQSDLNAFLEVFEAEALAQAQVIDRKFQAGTQGKLAGMVIGIKDVLCYENHTLQCASQILHGFRSQFTATAVRRLLAEDAIIIGRQNCDEFAMGSSNENSSFGSVKNAADTERVPGGSSGGSAVAVQADLCLASIGTDTGGSVRQPAAFCGVVGLKPTYSRISRYGLVAYASSFDCIGVLSKNIEDAAILLEVMAGKDEQDSTVSSQAVPPYSQELIFEGKAKIAYIAETMNSEGLNAEVKAATQKKIEALKAQGHLVESVEIPLLKYILPVYYILTTAEASSNLSRYDGVRYGFRYFEEEGQVESTSRLANMYKKTRTLGFGAEVKRRIMLGTFVLSADYYDAYYTKAQKVRRLIKEATDQIFENFDFILLPTTPSTAFKIQAHDNDPVAMYLEDLFTVQANVVGIPAISIPNGTDQNNLPIGLQLMAQTFQENKLLAFAKYILEKI